MDEVMTIKEFMDLNREKGTKEVITLQDSLLFASLIGVTLAIAILSGVANPVTLPAYLTL